MLNLRDREWGAFRIEEIAEIESGRGIYDNERKTGNIPYISSTSLNNGIAHFVSNDNTTKEAGCISVNSNGSIGYAFYHPYESLYSNDCRKLRVKHSTKYICIFIAHQIKMQRAKYSYGYKMGTARLKKQSVLLPVTEDGTPDWCFMDNYTREREQLQLKEYSSHAKKVIAEIGDIKNVLPLNEKEWKPFMLSDIFDIRAGKRLTRADMKTGVRPFIGATDTNNGITGFVSNSNNSLDNNVLGVNYNGSVVETFYHPYECIFSDDVKRFCLKAATPNKYLYLFLKTTIMQQKVKYAYGYKFNEQRMKKQLLLLPVKYGANEPDWAYMEQYAKMLYLRQLEAYLHYKDGL